MPVGDGNAGAHMTSGVSVKTAGVRPEAMTVAREAARRSGVSLTHWLNSAIIETAGVDDSAVEHEGGSAARHR